MRIVIKIGTSTLTDKTGKLNIPYIDSFAQEISKLKKEKDIDIILVSSGAIGAGLGYLNLTKKEGYNWGVIRGAMSSVAETCILTMQDIIGLGAEARINTPSTLGENWKWRAIPEDFSISARKKLFTYTKMFGRLNESFVKTEIKEKKED